MRLAKIGYLALGIALLGFVLFQADLGEAWERLRQIGWGLAAILAVYFVAFLLDVGSWHMTLVGAPLDRRWLYRLWKLRMVGEAFNNVTPLATMGGEPVKAFLLKKLYRVGYGEGLASLVLSKTTILLALVVFLGAGFLVMLGHGALSDTFKLAAGAGLAAITIGIVLFFLVQNRGVTTRTFGRLLRGRLGHRLEGMLHHVEEFDERLVRFYTSHRRRFAGSFLLAFANWLVSVLELYITLAFLGHPVTLSEALIIEAVAELVRAGTFFIPGRLGAQEGALMVVTAAITGSPALGLAAALVRRIREVVWIVWGLGLGWAALAGLDEPVPAVDVVRAPGPGAPGPGAPGPGE